VHEEVVNLPCKGFYVNQKTELLHGVKTPWESKKTGWLRSESLPSFPAGVASRDIRTGCPCIAEGCSIRVYGEMSTRGTWSDHHVAKISVEGAKKKRG